MLETGVGGWEWGEEEGERESWCRNRKIGKRSSFASCWDKFRQDLYCRGALWNQVEAGTLPEIPSLSVFFPIPVLLPPTPLAVSLGNSSLVNHMHLIPLLKL